MKQVIKITDIESGKELEMVKTTRDCTECFYYEKQGCIYFPSFPCDNIEDIIFKEVTTKEEKK